MQEAKKQLIHIFGERIAFHEIERMLYSTDSSVLPEFVKSQINTLPDAVVQPNSDEDLVKLTNLASKYGFHWCPVGPEHPAMAAPCRLSRESLLIFHG